MMNAQIVTITSYMETTSEMSEPRTLQSKANLLASMIAAFLSRSDSNANTKDCPCFACQNSA